MLVTRTFTESQALPMFMDYLQLSNAEAHKTMVDNNIRRPFTRLFMGVYATLSNSSYVACLTTHLEIEMDIDDMYDEGSVIKCSPMLMRALKEGDFELLAFIDGVEDYEERVDGDVEYTFFRHTGVSRHEAKPLIVEIIKFILMLLTKRIDIEVSRSTKMRFDGTNLRFVRSNS